MEKIKEEDVAIKGMHCKSCAELIETKLSMLKGVEKIKVSFPNEKAVIQFNPKVISLDVLKKEIESLGYKADLDDTSSISSKENKIKLRKNSIFQGIIYGLIPHTGCIAFIIFSVLGVTVATAFFKPLMLNPYFFYILIAISIMFATVSAFIYFKNQGFLIFSRSKDNFEISFLRDTLRRKWKYLTTLYGTTISINLFLFMIIFPIVANIDSGSSITGAFANAAEPTASAGSLTLQVNIPCPGHAPLITGELKSIKGVENVKFRFPNYFDVGYNPSQTSENQILSLDVFNTYKASVVNGAVVDDAQSTAPDADEEVGGCGAGCGGSCGAGAGGCGCGG